MSAPGKTPLLRTSSPTPSSLAFGTTPTRGVVGIVDDDTAYAHDQQRYSSYGSAPVSPSKRYKDPLLLFDLSCRCCCRRPRKFQVGGIVVSEDDEDHLAASPPPSCPRRWCRLRPALVALSAIVFCMMVGAVVYLLNLLAHLMNLCENLHLSMIIVPSVAALLWVLGGGLMFRSYRAHRQYHMETAYTSQIGTEKTSDPDQQGAGCCKKKCTGRRCASWTFCTSFWFLFFIVHAIIFVVFSFMLFFNITTLPTTSGSIALGHEALNHPVKIARANGLGILHITAQAGNDPDPNKARAQELHDLFFGQGFAHAQERMWQMEFQRAVSSGRLGELTGYNEDVLKIDRLARTMNFHAKAQQAYLSLSSGSRAVVDAYVEGVNALIHSSSFNWPIEFYILGLDHIRDYTAADILAWTKIVSYMLSGNMDRELQRWDLHVLLGVEWERVQQLIPPYAYDRFPTILEGEVDDVLSSPQAQAWTYPSHEPLLEWMQSKQGQDFQRSLKHARQAALKAGREHDLPKMSHEKSAFKTFRKVFGPSTASNNWVIGGNLTHSGKPLLANDPHLQLMAPSLWILNDLESPSFSAIGASFAGLPGVVLGHNNVLSWGVTNVGMDCQDLFIMDGNQTHYRWKNQTLAYTFRTETIKIKHHDDIILNVRESHYGPVINDLAFDIIGDTNLNLNGSFPAPFLSLRWTSLDEEDTTFDAFFNINQAQTWEEFKQASYQWRAPSQNLIYADEAGNIAYRTTGMVPLRPSGVTGLAPVPGSGEHDWVGFVSQDLNPCVKNPRKGYFATANNAVVPREYPVYLTGDWDAGSDGYRAKRITEMIVNYTTTPLMDDSTRIQQPQQQQMSKNARGVHTVDTIKVMQSDLWSGLFEDMQRYVLPNLTPQTDAGQKLQQQLLEMTPFEPVGSLETTRFQKWYATLQTIVQHETNVTHWDDTQWLLRTFAGWEVDKACTYTTEVDSEQQQQQQEAGGSSAPNAPNCLLWASHHFDRIAEKGQWTRDAWGQDLHRALFKHQILGASPLACVANRETPHGGDKSTVNVGTIDWDHEEDLQMQHGSSYRQIIDWSHGGGDGVGLRSQFIFAPGQSGNILSSHYDDLIGMWSHGGYVAIDPKDNVDSTLTIKP